LDFDIQAKFRYLGETKLQLIFKNLELNSVYMTYLSRITLAFSLAWITGIAAAQPSMRLTSDSKILPVLFQQQSAEYRALCYQAFNIATLRLESVKRKGLPLAIITDIDETILDNSYYEAQRIKDGKEFTPKTWKEWTATSNATLVPGAQDFLSKARLHNVTVFYISNRDTSEITGTLANLRKLDLPNADNDHLLLMTDVSSKERRRQQVMKHYDVIMLIGDNLNDFTTLFEKKTIAGRKAEVDLVQPDWGNKFIMLPNPMYGEWENALYNYDRNLTNEQKNALLLQRLIGY